MTDTGRITDAANELGAGLAKGGAAARALGSGIVNAVAAIDSTIAELEARVAALESLPEPPDPEPPDPEPPAHPYEDLTTYYQFPSGTVSFPDQHTVHCSVAAGDHSVWDSSCDFAGLSGPNFATGAEIHIDCYFRIDAGDPMTGNWLIGGEIHNDDGALGRATSPPMSVHFDHDHMGIVCIAGGSSMSNDEWMWPWTDPDPIERDRDYHLQIDVRFTNDGYLKVTRDGVVVVDYQGNIGYGAPTYWMPDIYRSNNNGSVRETTAIQFSRMQVWTGDPAALLHKGIKPQIKKSPMKTKP